MKKFKLILNNIIHYKISPFKLLKYLLYIFCVWIFQLFYKVDFIKGKIYGDNIHNSYEMTDIFTLNKILRNIKIHKEDKVLDIGCGKGLALMVLSKYFDKPYGIEFNKEIYQVCYNNMKKIKKNCCIINEDIIDYFNCNKFNYIFMFNPFGEDIMRQVISNLKPNTSIIYHNPVCENILYENNFVKIKECKDILGVNFNVYKN